ncbi:MAG: PrsW family intramembrane metalloprotease [Kiritimatiellales bacterium]|nr:PrsW family intramembrane metalloprotease [Kiritimatiellales bacterium]
MFKLTLLILSFLFGLLSIRHLRKYDVHEQEPFLKMAAVTVWGGLVSIILSLFLYRVLGESGVRIRDGLPFSYLYVGFVEELGKLAALFLCWPLIRNEMNEPTDGPIYIACVALGFSLIENYFYAQAHTSVTFLIAIRLIICTPMHIAFSMFMGLAFFWATRFKGGWGVLAAAYLAASVVHALYDIFVSYWFLLPGLYLILKGAYRWMYRLLGYTAAQSPFRKSLAACIHAGGTPEIEAGFECVDCGNTAPKPTYAHGRIRIQQCEACGTCLCDIKTLHQIVHQYGSLFGSLRRRVKRLSRHQKHIGVLIEANRIYRKKGVACFRLDEFNAVLERMSRDAIDKTERQWWCVWKTV